MAEDVLQATERYLSHDASRWARLASTIQFRRLQILLLRAILEELQEVSARLGASQPGAGQGRPDGDEAVRRA